MMESLPPQGGDTNKIAPSKTIEEALARLRANEKIAKAIDGHEIEKEKYGIESKNILRAKIKELPGNHPPVPKHPPVRSFYETKKDWEE